VGPGGRRPGRPRLRGPRPDHVGVRRPVQGRAEPGQAAGPRRHVRPGRGGGPVPRRSAALRLPARRRRAAPNPAKAADGKRLHKLEPDPDTAWVIRRIFAEYLAGRGLFAIAEGLTRDQIPSPSQHDRARNPHRTGQGWSKSAVRVILANPRYTGRQVWNKQRKDEILLDVDDVAAGYETRMRWNEPGRWVWSDVPAHEPLITAEDFQAA
jgi:recombinase